MAWTCQSPRISRLICRGGCRRGFGRSWAKALAKKGKFVFLVNEGLIRVASQENAGGRTSLEFRALLAIFPVNVTAPGSTIGQNLASHWLPRILASQEGNTCDSTPRPSPGSCYRPVRPTTSNGTTRSAVSAAGCARAAADRGSFSTAPTAAGPL